MVERLQGEKVVGIKQVLKALKNGKGKTLYIAKDVDRALVEPIIELAHEKTININYTDTVHELGRLCGIEVGASAALLL